MDTMSVAPADRVDFAGDNPLARFGHTITPISKDKALLFGGAVGEGGRYIITGDTFIGDFTQKRWKKLEIRGSLPSNRAAHGATCIDHYLFIYGGALGGGELADGNLYQLDFHHYSEQGMWSIVETLPGPTPGQRYGHIMAAFDKSIIIHGGNTGSEAVGDLWQIKVLNEGPKVWEKIIVESECPSPRVYHSASFCRAGSANSMLVIFGGRSADQSPLNDTWGLRRHRNGKIDWMPAPERSNNPPTARYQHRTLFIGTLLVIVGGRNNDVGEALPLDVFDTEASEWFKLQRIQRFRHACMLVGSELFIHGGFDQDKPNIPTDMVLRIDLHRLFFHHRSLMTGLAYELGIEAINHNVPRLTRSQDSEMRERNVERHSITSNSSGRYSALHNSEGRSTAKRLLQTPNRQIKLIPDIIVANFNEQSDIKKVKLNQLQLESRRILKAQMSENTAQTMQKIYKYFLNYLFCRPIVQINFPLPQDYVVQLLETVERLVTEEQTLVKIRAPVKIIGDLHGQVTELNRYFESFGAPIDDQPNGDIEFTNYLFLGDYVNRGNRSVELLLLLFSLKLKFPDEIILLRGSSEDPIICRSLGFADECQTKFRNENINDPSSFYSRCIRIFERLPLAALIEGEILCVHGGIGQTLQNLEELETIQRPIKINHNPQNKQEKIIYELLWSDPCRANESEPVINMEHDYFKKKQNYRYPESRAVKFCNFNDLLTIVRSGEPVAEGYEAKESFVSIFSCTDYGGFNNKGSMLHISKTQEIRPLIINALVNRQPRWIKLDENMNADDRDIRARPFTPPRT